MRCGWLGMRKFAFLHSSPASRSRGLTLLEMLVVLVLTALVGTLVAQGLGFFLGKYDAVRRHQFQANQAGLQQRWFVSSVQSMVPLIQSERGFFGESSGFEGTSMQPLGSEPGLPRRIGWQIVLEESNTHLYYLEKDVDTTKEAINWRVRSEPLASWSFEYADANGQWHDRWPVVDSRIARIPRMVRLVNDAGQTLWLVRLNLYPEPVANFRIIG